MKIRATFTEALLGTWPNNPTIAEDFVASKAPDASTLEEEIAAIGADAAIEKGKTVFPRWEGKPVVYDYQIKGAFKDAAGMLRNVPGTESSKIKAYKKFIDGLIFVSPRHIPIEFDGEMGSCQRPLRASTPMGERISLAHSEEIPEGAVIEFEVECLNDNLEPLVLELLEYGKLRGLGQWRNSGKGRYVYDLLDEGGKVIGGNNPANAVPAAKGGRKKAR